MRSTRLWITLSCCLFAMTLAGWAQGRKPGLWEMTTTTTWQQSPFPPGMAAASPSANPFMASGLHTTLVCLTQEQIDRYGAIVPSTRGCQVTNLVKSAHGMTADWVCNGMMSGKGTLESSWSDENRAVGKVHFAGSIQAGPNPKPIEWTAESTSVFKGADCGAVKPMAMPNK